MGPAKKKDGADFVKHMFKKAKEHGAEAVDPSAGPQASGSRSVFTGAGMTLGSNGKSQTLVNVAPKYFKNFDSFSISGILDPKWRKLNFRPILSKWVFQKL